MEPERLKVIEEALKDMERQVNTLQIQVLNNLDALVTSDRPTDLEMLDRLVKKPMMLAITRLKADRSNLIRQINQNG